MTITVVQRNAIDLLTAYQNRHKRMTTEEFRYWRGSSPLFQEQAYWNWRNRWLSECLRHCPPWANVIAADLNSEALADAQANSSVL